jgi:hypothetical protein
MLWMKRFRLSAEQRQQELEAQYESWQRLAEAGCQPPEWDRNSPQATTTTGGHKSQDSDRPAMLSTR